MELETIYKILDVFVRVLLFGGLAYAIITIIKERDK